MLLLWFELILYLQLISELAKYIYIMLNILKEIWIFLAFMILVIAGLAHSFLLLLQYPDFINITELTSLSTLYTGDSNFKIQKDFDRTEDNPSKLSNYFTKHVYCFYRGVYSNAFEKGRVALLRFRAVSISDYEALDEIYFYPPTPEPEYIYYIGKSKSHENWDENVKKLDKAYSKIEEIEGTSVKLNNEVVELDKQS
ncbi:12262_t:CDS:2 [Funneliformis caledonium]|uniref:12262_t:CDS:1 n=1 Tax=Funneliformis caledonium TaxID=1117310 RepID=A0A9N9CNK1_9GLOM|nr:12262_t:CDS:2 [Funneliformis caledonium]